MSASLGEAVKAIQAAESDIGMPPSIQGTFQGTARAFQASLANEGWLILAAIVTVYIVLGVSVRKLHSSHHDFVDAALCRRGRHPGAYLFHMDLGVMALIGIILLIGIVKKNAIMMIDFALEAERKEGKQPVDAIYEACLLRFRPIMMTTFAALFGAVPLALGSGTGSELRRPLGVTIIGGLLFSQMLTLYTTPVVYLWFDRLGTALSHLRAVPSRLRPTGRLSMNISAPAIERPIATTLLTIALLLAGGLAYMQLPVSPLPQIDYPVISVGASLPGASPETMASAVATPLERQFGRIAGINQMTSVEPAGHTGITMQFDLDRNIDAAARDVQAAINAARGYLPADLPSNPTYRKINPGGFADHDSGDDLRRR